MCTRVEVFSHDTSFWEGDKKTNTEDIYQLIKLFQRYSRVTLLNPLISIFTNLSTVPNLQNLITSFTINAQNHMVLEE